MRVVEVSVGGAAGEASHSGVQVEYATHATVDAVNPMIGSAMGGTLVTLTGSGFVAGRTGCRFGSAADGADDCCSYGLASI